jgi:hypothetical protein
MEREYSIAGEPGSPTESGTKSSAKLLYIIHNFILLKRDSHTESVSLDRYALGTDCIGSFHPDKCTVLTITQKKTPFKHDYILHNHTYRTSNFSKIPWSYTTIEP